MNGFFDIIFCGLPRFGYSSLTFPFFPMSYSKNSLLSALLAAAFLFGNCGQENTRPETSQTNKATGAEMSATSGNSVNDFSTRPAKLGVLPPLERVNVAPQVQTVSPQKPTVLTMPSGSTVEIPVGAFVDASGAPVTKPVDIHFREFHRPAEIISSGIPMKVRDAQGHEDWMQTAGMFEIEGFCEGKPVKIAPDKSLTIQLVSSEAGEYDQWFFDPVAGNWADVGNSTPRPNQQAAPLVKEINQLRSMVKLPPSPPRSPEKGKASLDFKVDVSKFPELRKLQGIVWQYAGKDPALDPSNNKWIRTTPWIEAKLEAGNAANQYVLTLVGEEKDYTIPVEPTLTGHSLEEAQQQYQAAIKEYEANKVLLAQKEAIAAEQMAFRRSFTVKGFGIYNYDILTKNPENIPIYADFDMGTLPEEVKKMVTVYLITSKGRVVVGLPFYDWSNLRINPNSDNRMVALLPGNRIAVFSQEDFNAEMPNIKKAANNRYTFKMSVQEQPIVSVEDLEKRIYAN